MKNAICLLTLTFSLILCCNPLFARGRGLVRHSHAGPHRGPLLHNVMRPAPHFTPRPKHHHNPFRYFGRDLAVGVIAGVVGGTLVDAITTPAPVVYNYAPVAPTRVVRQENVWVEGRYVEQIQPSGNVVRVWQPGHYETREIIEQ